MFPLKGERVLVIGAAGFIGGRLTERLLFEHGARVTALVRSYARAGHLACLDVDIHHGDVTDGEQLRRLSEDCSYIVNCAYSASGSRDRDLAVNATGTLNVLEATRLNRIRRVVHISTVSVMGPNPPDGADENHPCRPTGELYSDTKLEGERLALAHHVEHKSPVVIVRPTVVYGPRSPAWTLGPIARIRADQQFLIGRGRCSPVYIDNLIDAVILAMTTEGIDGEVFNISDGVPVDWRVFLGYYAAWCGGRLRRRRFLTAQALALVVRCFDRLARSLVDVVFGDQPEKVRRGAVSYARQLLFPGIERESVWVRFFASRSVVSVEKARRLLGYEPRVPLDEGMAMTKKWLQIQGLI